MTTNPYGTISVIIPSRDGYGGGNLPRLRSQIDQQTVKPLEVIVVVGVSPNGRARNVGVRKARGEMLILIDDDVALGNDRVFENLLRPFRDHPEAGMTGASVLLPHDCSWLGQKYARARGMESKLVSQLTDSNKVQHPCCAIRTQVYKDVGWESDDLISGTDDDLRQRVRKAGFKLYVVPETWVYHHVPDRLFTILRRAFISGIGSAYALRVHPEIFGRPTVKLFGCRLKRDLSALVYRMAATFPKVFAYLAALNPVTAVVELATTAGYVTGWVRYRRGREP